MTASTTSAARVADRDRLPGRPPRGCSYHWCLALTVLSALYLAAVVVVQHAWPEDFLPTYVLTYMPQPLLLAALAPALFFSLIFWHRGQVLFNLALVVGGIVLLMPPNVPSRPPPHDPQRTVRIVTWNVREEFARAEQIAAVLARLDPDIVCLQESRRGSFGQVLPGAEVAHTREVTTLVRGEILGSRPVRLGPYPNYRWAIETDVRLPQGRVKILNVHFLTAFSGRTVRRNRQNVEGYLETRQEARHLETGALLEWLRQTNGPRLVAGDFNSPPNSRIYRQISARMTNAFGAVGRGWGWTFHRRRPMTRIDHVFCTGGVVPVAAFTVNGRMSDHKLVVADVALPGD